MLRFAAAFERDVCRVLSGDALDRELRGAHDGGNGGVVAPSGRPTNVQFALILAHLEVHVRVGFQSKPRGLEYGGDGRADDVVAGLSPFGVAARMKKGQPIAAVPSKNHGEH